jgi:hypothetical protein
MDADRARWRDLIRPAVAAVVLHLVFMAVYVYKHHRDITSLICAGTKFVSRSPAYSDITLLRGPSGYDGQFYYLIAQGPWRTYGVEIDVAPARHLRILYPALCYSLSGGEPRILFWVMPAVNLIVIGLIALFGALLARHFGENPWWGFTLPLALSTGVSSLHDLTDPLGMLGAVALLWCWLSNRPSWQIAAAAVVAMLAREQNLAIAVLLLGIACWRGRFADAGGLAVAIAIFAGWVALLWSAYERWPFIPAGDGEFEPIFAGILFKWTHLGGTPVIWNRFVIIDAALMTFLMLQFGLLVVTTCRCDGELSLLGVAWGGALLAALAGSKIYADFWGITRVFFWLPLGLWCLGLQTQRRWIVWSLIPGAAWSILAARGYV